MVLLRIILYRYNNKAQLVDPWNAQAPQKLPGHVMYLGMIPIEQGISNLEKLLINHSFNASLLLESFIFQPIPF